MHYFLSMTNFLRMEEIWQFLHLKNIIGENIFKFSLLSHLYRIVSNNNYYIQSQDLLPRLLLEYRVINLVNKKYSFTHKSNILSVYIGDFKNNVYKYAMFFKEDDKMKIRLHTQIR